MGAPAAANGDHTMSANYPLSSSAKEANVEFKILLCAETLKKVMTEETYVSQKTIKYQFFHCVYRVLCA